MAETNWEVLAQLYYSGEYNILDDLVANDQGAKFERGVADDLDLKPSTCSFRLLDDDDRYRPSNAASDLYGITGAWMRAAFATGGAVQFTGETTKMAPGQTDDLVVDGSNVVQRGVRWVDVAASGPLGRVGKWREPLASALFTQISSYGTALKGYFPLEDGKDATQLTNVIPNGRPGKFTGITLAGDDAPGGSGPCVQMGSTAQTLSFPYAGMSTTAGWQIGFAAKIINADATLRTVYTWKTSNGYTWSWQVSNGSYAIVATDVDGNLKLSSTVLPGDDAFPGQWIFTRIKVSQSGSTVTVEPSWYAESAQNFWGTTSTFTGSIGAPTQGTVPATAATNGASFAHHFVVSGTSTNLESTDFTNAFLGYLGERAADRFDRLMRSRGLPFQVRGDYDKTPRMGAQPIITFQDQLKEIRATSRGLIFDRGDNLGIVLATLEHIEAAAADPWELTYPDDVAPGLAEVTGSAELFNLITAANRNGASSTRELTVGRQGTDDPPTGSGRLDKKVDVNLFSESELDDVTSWWLNFYTQDVPRFDTITVDLDANPGLLTAANAAEPGTFIRLTGRTPDPLLLMIISRAGQTQRKRNLMTFTVVPGNVFDTAIYDDSGSRYGSATTFSAEAMTTTETDWTIWTSNRHECWSTTPGYEWMVAGERVLVTAMTAPTWNSTVNLWEQTATVTRSRNGVVKAQLLAERIYLADQKRYG